MKPKIFEPFYLFQCNSVGMQRTLIGVSEKMQNLSLCSADFHSGDITCTYNTIYYVLEIRFSVSKKEQDNSK